MASTTGFIPTMGALHEGHRSLVQAAKRDCDRVVVSIFVNPTQFGPGEDFERYPRDFGRDRALLAEDGVDAIWIPMIDEIYPEGIENVERVEPPVELMQVLCGKDRPDHFSGVATVVKRLFEHVQPTDVYFGQKDYQQTRVVDWLIREYFSKIRLHVEPTVREADGLAMSSRNVYLSKNDRELALSLSRSLGFVSKLFEQGERDVKGLEEALLKELDHPGIEVLYAEIRDAHDLHELSVIQDSAVALVGAKIGSTRLIDNVLLKCLRGNVFSLE